MSWPMVKLGDYVTHISSGATPRGGSENYSDFGPVMFLRSQNIHMNELRLDDVIYVSDDIHEKMARSEVKFGDVLINITGASIGRVASFELKDKKVNSNQHVCTIRPKAEALYYKYLSYFLGSESFQREIFSSQRGGTREALNYSQVREFRIPLPPLAEQKRIAAILDKADAIRRKRQQAIQLADDFLRAVFLEMFGDPVSNPKGWEVKLLKDIAKIQIGPFGTQLHKEDYVSDGIPLINPSHIKNSEVVPDFNLTVSKTKFEELAEYHLTVGDIIMGRRGEMGRCALIGERESGWLCGTGSLYIRPFIGDAQSFYLFKYLTSDYIKTYLEGESLGATMPNLNKTIVGNIKVPMPSTEAITKFQNILAADRAYREKVTLIDDSLFESLSQKAFSGQL